MTYLQLAALGWGFLAATFVGMVIHGNQKARAARDFHDHTTTAMRVGNHPATRNRRVYIDELLKPHCTTCWATFVGPVEEHSCGDRA